MAIRVVATGGTIASLADPETGAVRPAVGAEDLVRSVPGLDAFGPIVVEELDRHNGAAQPRRRRHDRRAEAPRGRRGRARRARRPVRHPARRFPAGGHLARPGHRRAHGRGNELRRRHRRRDAALADHDAARRHIEFCLDLAVRHDADVDMHVDETDDGRWRSFELLVDEAERRGWGGRTSAGHVCAMAAWEDDYAAAVSRRGRRERDH